MANTKGTPKSPRPKKSAVKKSAVTKAAAETARQSSGWAARVVVGAEGFAYVPNEVLTTGGDAAVKIAQRLFPNDKIAVAPLDGRADYQRFTGVPDVLRLVAELRRAGLGAQPNHVMFAHGCGCPCWCPPHPAQVWCGGGGVAGAPAYASPAYASPAYASPAYASPAYASPAYASPAYASPAYASPAYASPAYASPAYASPAYASPEQATGIRRSSARPAVEPWVTIAAQRLAAAPISTTPASVVVLDTGLATAAFQSAAVSAVVPLWSSTAQDGDQPDEDADQALDAAAGHGTFIAGLIQQAAPGTSVALHRVLHAQGDGDEVQISAAIDALPDPPAEGALLNLSFGGYVFDDPALLASSVAGAQARGYVVVASAGNDATCRPSFPAALPDVVAVGAVGPFGPAPFTNHGAWVRACAPGVDLVSTFFAGWDGGEPVTAGTDPDAYVGWACWSGTSFAAPVVVGALAREMAVTGCTASEAVTRLIDNPALLRIPGLGTVVNAL